MSAKSILYLFMCFMIFCIYSTFRKGEEQIVHRHGMVCEKVTEDVMRCENEEVVCYDNYNSIHCREKKLNDT